MGVHHQRLITQKTRRLPQERPGSSRRGGGKKSIQGRWVGRDRDHAGWGEESRGRSGSRGRQRGCGTWGGRESGADTYFGRAALEPGQLAGCLASAVSLLVVKLQVLQALRECQLLLDGHAQQRVQRLLLILRRRQLPLHLIQLGHVLITPEKNRKGGQRGRERERGREGGEDKERQIGTETEKGDKDGERE